jgi:hypothetical protein
MTGRDTHLSNTVQKKRQRLKTNTNNIFRMTFGADYFHPERFEVLEKLRPQVGKWLHEYYDKWEAGGRPSLIGQAEVQGFHEILKSYNQFERDKVKGILYLTCSKFFDALFLSLTRTAYKRGMTLVYRFNLKRIRNDMKGVLEKIKEERVKCNTILDSIE